MLSRLRFCLVKLRFDRNVRLEGVVGFYQIFVVFPHTSHSVLTVRVRMWYTDVVCTGIPGNFEERLGDYAKHSQDAAG